MTAVPNEGNEAAAAAAVCDSQVDKYCQSAILVTSAILFHFMKSLHELHETRTS